MGGGIDAQPPQGLSTGSAVSGLRSGGAPARPVCRRNRVSLPVLVRGLRFAGGAGDGGGNAGDHLGGFVASRGRRRGGVAGGSAQFIGSPRRTRTSAAFARPARAPFSGRPPTRGAVSMG